MKTKEKFMQEAIYEAEKGRGSVSPNPLVGAVVVKGNKIVSRGYHTAFGKAHAEVEALKNIGLREKFDLYVTFEPCAHYGKTPPCIDLILKYKNINEVIIGIKDPNPQVNGKSLRLLKKDDIKVVTGVLSDEIKKQNETYLFHLKNKRPFVTLKSAITLDGKIATKEGYSKWISSASSRKIAHKLRAENDAIMVGIGTVLADDPLLIPRNVDKKFKPPKRIIIDPGLKIPLQSKIIKSAKAYPTFVVCSNAESKSKYNKLIKKSINIINLKSSGKNGHFKMKDLMIDLGSRNIASLLIEGGSKINNAVLSENLVNKFVFFVAPKLFGGTEFPVIGGDGIDYMKESINLKFSKVQLIDKDIFVEAYINGK